MSASVTLITEKKNKNRKKLIKSHGFNGNNIFRQLTMVWFEPRSGHMWESQVLLTDGQVVFLRVLRFSPTFDERPARYK